MAGGWHFPLHFYSRMALQNLHADKFVIAHRNPELPIISEEHALILRSSSGPLADLDRELYACYATISQLEALEWEYQLSPNICGDWCFLNQWMETHDYRDYDAILSCHDDTYIRRYDIFEQLDHPRHGNWLILANGNAVVEPPGYVRGSFEFFSRELLDMLGGKIDLGDVRLTREGQVDSPRDRQTLQPWNDTGVPLRTFLVEQGLTDRIARLSPYYRVSPWAIEGERGFIHMQAWAPEWRMDQGLEAYPL